MRKCCASLLCFLCALCVFVVQGISAQEPRSSLRFTQVRVGFSSTVENEAQRFKIGMWAPIVVELQTGPEGIAKAELDVETSDSENVGTIYTVPVENLKPNEKRTIVTYSRPGNSDGRFTLSVRSGNQVLTPPFTVSQPPMDLRENLYLTVGCNLPELHEALLTMRRQRQDAAKDDKDSWPRRAAYLTNPEHLPDLPLGYDAVDLMILASANEPIVQRLLADGARLKAVAGWVREGGRLVVSVAPKKQRSASQLLSSPAWKPPLPVVPPPEPVGFPERSLPRLLKVEEWAGVSDKPFPAFGQDPVPVSWLQPGEGSRPDWRVLAETPEGRPLITQMPYGRGQVTLLAFDIDRQPFSAWEGRALFLKAMVSKLAPRIPQIVESDAAGPNQPAARDLATQLQTTLDQFDVAIIYFGWVAMLILAYILLVGPIDYFLLGRALKRLQWTWITFPLVVLAVSVLVYFAVYDIKGEELKINQVDLVDFDLRTELDAKLRTARAHAYGNTWFTLLSPKIKHYAIGVEPGVVPGWIAGRENGLASVVSWLGRPEYDGPAAMGRPRIQTFAQKSYQYLRDARGLTGVPIPIWTSKSFMASWETPLPQLPFQADLSYHHEREVMVSGSIQSFLPMDLHDVWLFFGHHCYFLEGGLKGSRSGGEIRKIALDQRYQAVYGWPRRRDADAELPPAKTTAYDPVTIVKEMLFHELADTAHLRNHTFHRLDLSWRLQEHRARLDSVREVILFGRVHSASGKAEEMMSRPNRFLPSLIWLDTSHGADAPILNATMVQDTFVRALLPVRPAPE